jgi:hypothetical protein
MCIAILKKPSAKADWDAYQKGYDSNKDSWGFAVAYKGNLIVRRGTKGFDQFAEAFAPYASGYTCAIHFRIATSGKVDYKNAHPFKVAGDLAVIHNGMIDIKLDVNKNFSDTWHWVQCVGKPAYKRDPLFWRRPDVKYTNQLAHRSSKFVFLDAYGSYAIWNESSGHWSDGHWWSNSSYKRTVYTTEWGPRSTFGYKPGIGYSGGLYKGRSEPSKQETKERLLDLGDLSKSDQLMFPHFSAKWEGFVQDAAGQLWTSGMCESEIKELAIVVGRYSLVEVATAPSVASVEYDADLCEAVLTEIGLDSALISSILRHCGPGAVESLAGYILRGAHA